MQTLWKLLTVACLSMVASAELEAQEYKVIVNSANEAASSLSGDVVAKLFLKQEAKFPDGTPSKPVDQVKASASRAAFSKAVLGRPVAAIETYWQQQIFAGRDVPPPAKATDDEVIAFVKATPGAIGYVSAGAATASVRVVQLK